LITPRYNPLIVALDNLSSSKLLNLAQRLQPTGCILKLEDALFREGISHFMPLISIYGQIMADVKINTIPKTAENICRAFRACPPWAITAHASGGPEMLRAIRHTLPMQTKLLAVTVLTSLDRNTCEEIFVRRPFEQVKTLAALAWDEQVDGFVCSPHPDEVSTLRSMFPHAILATPGCRSPGMQTHDQKRVATPAEAIAAGATHPIMGRQITQNDDPVAEVRRIQREELRHT
jgi:orotidine-5'-phosphate decarboxylase